MKIHAAVLVWALAAVAGAQTTIRGGGSSTITAGTTATSGCTDGGFLYSLTSLIRCGANATNDGTTATFGTGVTIGGSSTSPFVDITGTWNTSAGPTALKVNVTNTASSSGKLFDFRLGGTSVLNLIASAGSSGTGYSNMTLTAAAGKQSLMSLVNDQGNLVLGTEGSSGGSIAYDTTANAALVYSTSAYPLQFGTNNRMWLTLATTGAFTIGSSSLGNSVVPLTVTPGTGSAANLLNLTNSAGSTLTYVNSTGSILIPNASALMNTSGYNIASMDANYWRANLGGGQGTGNTATYVGGQAGGSGVGQTVVGTFIDAGSGTFNTYLGYQTGGGVATGGKNTIVGARVSGLTSSLSNNIILADGDGLQRYRAFAPVTLTEAGGAETVLTLTSATTNTFTVDVDYMVTAKDATPDYATRKGSVGLVCINNATVVTCTKSATNETDDGRNGGGSLLINTNAKTLTYAIGVDVATANVAKLTFNIDSDMTVTAASITMTVTINGTVTPS